MIDLNARQRAALLAGLELLRKQIESTRKLSPGGLMLSPKQLAELSAIIRGNAAATAASHRHSPDGGRQRSYNVAGECSIHGAICIACEITWHLEDGPLDWCRECDRVLAGARELAPSATTKRSARRRSVRAAPRR
jgi:hypothetical protein